MKPRMVKSGEYHNYIELSEINNRAENNPADFVAGCEQVFDREMSDAAAHIIRRMPESPVVLLSGPSASGKTTTAHRLMDALAAHGVRAHTVSLDNYFLTIDRNDLDIDFEAPQRLDIPLITAHMEALSVGDEVDVPTFDFITGSRTKDVSHMRLAKDEVAIFEGIHALNDMFFLSEAHRPTGIYVSARMRVTNAGQVQLEPYGARFVRRCVRDNRVRGSDFNRTLSMWSNVRHGETKYIMPYKKHAELIIDTSFDYELNLLAQFARQEMKTVCRERLHEAGMAELPEFLDKIADISPKLVPARSILREFVGNAGITEQKNC